MTHSLTHFYPGFNRSAMADIGRINRIEAKFKHSNTTVSDNRGLVVGGPTRTRTWNQRIHFVRNFRSGVDYLITLSLRWWGAGRSSLL